MCFRITRITFDEFWLKSCIWSKYWLRLLLEVATHSLKNSVMQENVVLRVTSEQIELEGRATSQIVENWIMIQMHSILF